MKATKGILVRKIKVTKGILVTLVSLLFHYEACDLLWDSIVSHKVQIVNVVKG